MKNKKFTKADIKVGYAVKFRDGNVALVTMSGYYGWQQDPAVIFIQNDENWYKLDNYADDLRTKPHTYGTEHDVMEVYGYSKWGHYALRFSTESRPLLWKREEKTCDQCIHKVVCSHVGMCEHFAEKK